LYLSKTAIKLSETAIQLSQTVETAKYSCIYSAVISQKLKNFSNFSPSPCLSSTTDVLNSVNSSINVLIPVHFGNYVHAGEL